MNYKQSNWLIDTVMPQVTGNAYKVIAFVARQTWGWQEKRAQISISGFQEGMGVARATAASAVDEALDSGFIRRAKVGNSFEYWPVMEIVPESSTFQKVERTRINNDNGSESSTTTVPESSTPPSYIKNQEKEVKESTPGPQVIPTLPGADLDDYDPEVQQMMDTLADVCRERRGAHEDKLKDKAKILLHEGFTPDDVITHFGGDQGNYWHTFSHGRKGERPWAGNVVSEIVDAVNGTGVAGAAVNGRGIYEADDAAGGFNV